MGQLHISNRGLPFWDREMECDGCAFCCWSFAVSDMPTRVDFTILQLKPAQTHCDFEFEGGCVIYREEHFPPGCRLLPCPYLEGEDIHRPDTFQAILEESHGNVGNYIPSIPRSIPIQRALRLIRETRSVLAVIILDGKLTRVALPLDRDAEGMWYPTQEILAPWAELCAKYGVQLVPNETP